MTNGQLSPDALLSAASLRIELSRRDGARTLVSSVTVDVHAGETVGIVGESGSGKSLTARALIGLLPEGIRATGEIRYRGRDVLGLSERSRARLRGQEIGMVFQDPYTMLNPLHRCGAHIAESLAGVPRPRKREEVIRRLREVGISDPTVADRYPFQLSGGMRQRVAIAAALARDPKLLIADEPSTALDVTTQAEILQLLKRLQDSREMGLVFITHDLRLAFSICDRVYVFYAGAVLETAPAQEMEREPLHPYTLGLLLSEPPLASRLRRLKEIKGAVPQPDSVRDCCPFTNRCQWAADECRHGATPLRPFAGTTRSSACVRVDEIRPGLAEQRNSSLDGALAMRRTRNHSTLLFVDGVSKTFTDGSRRVTALNGVHLELEEGESVGLVGESGSGKTTLGRCVVGLESPDSGRIQLDGIDVTSYASLSKADRKRARKTAQIIFQDPYSSLNPARSIGSTLEEAISVTTDSARKLHERAADLLRLVGLPADYAVRRPAALSGGERQRVAIARALALKPRLIICDEPVSALDVSVQAQILNLLNGLREELGVSYLFITHDLAVVRQMADRVYVLFRGDLVEHGDAETVLDQPVHSYTQRLLASVPG